jgi:O-antigen ligase
MLLYGGQYYQATWLPDSARHRVVIWGYTADQVAKAPFLGVGISSARARSDPNDESLPKAPGTNFQLSTTLHSHNAYLQVWYETGAVGAFLLLGLGLLVLRTLRSAPPRARPHLHATFAAGALLAASSFSIWAPWFMASLALVCIPAALGARLSERAGD